MYEHDKLLSVQEFYEAFYIEFDNSVTQWRKLGMPCIMVKVPRKGRVWLYPKQACHDWFAGKDVVWTTIAQASCLHLYFEDLKGVPHVSNQPEPLGDCC